MTAIVLAGGLWLLLGWYSPAPKSALTIAAGPSTGAYYHYAQVYRERLQARGISVQVVETRGTQDNLACLRNESDLCSADIAFVQAGPWNASQPPFESLASVAIEPIWVFVDARRMPLAQLGDLRGRAVALGEHGSGTLPVAQALLRASGIELNLIDARHLGGPAALAALAAGEVSAVVMVASASAPVIDDAIARGFTPMPIDNAVALSRRLPWALQATLSRGTLSVENNAPPSDVPMLAAMTNLVVNPALHESVKYLLLDVASQVHAAAGPMHNARQFPSAEGLVFAQAEASKDHFLGHRPWLGKWLPIALAHQITRLLLSVLPVMVILLPLLRALMMFGERRNRASIMRLFARARRLQLRIEEKEVMTEEDLQELALIEQQVGRFRPLTIHSVDFFRIHDVLPVLRTASARQAVRDGAEAPRLSVVRASAAASPRSEAV